jgi:hypothetical protein
MKKLLKSIKIISIQLLIIVALILVTDIILTKFNLISLKASFNGDINYGFSQEPTIFGDTNFATNDSIITIAVTGDSHTAYLDKDSIANQANILHIYLEENGIKNRVVLCATPRHSPNQSMLVYEYLLKEKYKPEIFINILYAGNDFAEIIRNDDRPMVEFEEGESFISRPNWVLNRPIDGKTDINRWPSDSRLLYLMNALIGRSNLLLKLKAVNISLEKLNPSFGDKIEYIKNLNRFKDTRLGYQGAVAAQFLNQYYLMDKYPEKFRYESLKRMKYFFENFNKRNPNTKAYCFYLPSAPAIDVMLDENKIIYKDILKRSNLTEIDIPSKEKELYDSLVNIATNTKSKISLYDLSDTLKVANTLDGTQTFYDQPTIHIDVKARKVVGEKMGSIILKDLKSN